MEGSGGGSCDQDYSSVSGGSGSYDNEDQSNGVWWLQGTPSVQWGGVIGIREVVTTAAVAAMNAKTVGVELAWQK